MILVLTGVSGSGKSTQANELINNYNFKTIPSYTSRNPRENEENHVHYHFITKDDFEQKINENFFFEYTKKFENYYATSFEEIEKYKKNYNIVLCLCPLGYIAAKKHWRDEVIGAYLLPPDEIILKERLSERKSNIEEINLRLQDIHKTVNQESKLYEHIIKHDSIEIITQKLLILTQK